MHENTAHEYEYLPHDHLIHLTCRVIDCHNVLSIFMAHTDFPSSIHCASKKYQRINGPTDQWINEWL